MTALTAKAAAGFPLAPPAVTAMDNNRLAPSIDTEHVPAIASAMQNVHYWTYSAPLIAIPLDYQPTVSDKRSFLRRLSPARLSPDALNNTVGACPASGTIHPHVASSAGAPTPAGSVFIQIR